MDAPAQNVRSDQVFDGIEHPRIADQAVYPPQEQAGLDSLGTLERMALVGFEGFELSTSVSNFCR